MTSPVRPSSAGTEQEGAELDPTGVEGLGHRSADGFLADLERGTEHVVDSDRGIAKGGADRGAARVPDDTEDAGRTEPLMNVAQLLRNQPEPNRIEKRLPCVRSPRVTSSGGPDLSSTSPSVAAGPPAR